MVAVLNRAADGQNHAVNYQGFLTGTNQVAGHHTQQEGTQVVERMNAEAVKQMHALDAVVY